LELSENTIFFYFASELLMKFNQIPFSQQFWRANAEVDFQPYTLENGLH